MYVVLVMSPKKKTGERERVVRGEENREEREREVVCGKENRERERVVATFEINN